MKNELSKEQLLEDINFQFFDMETRNRLKSYEPVVLLPGLLIGLHNSFFDYITFIADKWGVDKIRLVCHTWDYRLNNSWVDKFKEVCEDHPRVNLQLITESYDKKLFHNFLNSLKINLGGEVNGFVDSQFFKRFVVYYSMMRAYEEFLSDSPKETYIFKVRSCYLYADDYRPDVFEHIWRAKTTLGPDTLREKYHFTDDLDIVFSPVNAPDRISESLFFTSITSFRNILGTSRAELVDKLSEVMLGLQNRLNLNEEISKLDFETKMNNFAIFPYSGAIIFRKLINNFSTKLITSEGCIRTMDLNTKWDNPIINIADYKTHTYLKGKKLKTHYYKLDEYIINYRRKSVV